MVVAHVLLELASRSEFLPTVTGSTIVGVALVVAISQVMLQRISRRELIQVQADGTGDLRRHGFSCWSQGFG